MHCRFHEIADQHVVEDLVFDRQHERMARCFKRNASISLRTIHSDGVSLAAYCDANETEMIFDMLEALKISR